jgi:hypothetical protein
VDEKSASNGRRACPPYEGGWFVLVCHRRVDEIVTFKRQAGNPCRLTRIPPDGGIFLFLANLKWIHMGLFDSDRNLNSNSMKPVPKIVLILSTLLFSVGIYFLNVGQSKLVSRVDQIREDFVPAFQELYESGYYDSLSEKSKEGFVKVKMESGFTQIVVHDLAWYIKFESIFAFAYLVCVSFLLLKREKN